MVYIYVYLSGLSFVSAFYINVLINIYENIPFWKKDLEDYQEKKNTRNISINRKGLNLSIELWTEVY